MFSVLCFYKTIATFEEDSINPKTEEAPKQDDRVKFSGLKSLIGFNQKVEKDIPDDVYNDMADLTETRKKIRELEWKLRRIEARMENQNSPLFPVVKFLNYKNRKRILVTGGAGFVGSHLVDRLMLAGHEVTVADNFFTGRKRNVEHWIGHENFELVHHDIVRPLYLEVDEIYHLASPASPPHYMLNPVKTIKTNTLGTINMLGKFIKN